MISTILTPLDGSALAECALPYAAYLVRATGARLLLLHASPDLDLVTRLEAGLDLNVTLEPHLDALRRHGIEVAARTTQHLPAPAILAAAREDRVDLIVMSTHGRGGLGRWLYGSVADDVLRQSSVPVLLVSAACDRQWQTDRPFRILVPLDGSLRSESALVTARELAEQLKSELVLVRAIQQPTAETYRYDVEGEPISVPEGDVDLDQVCQYLEAIAARQLATFGSVELLAELGEAARVVVGAACRANADLIVMATHARTGLERLALGSVSTTVVQRAGTPVLLVRPDASPNRAEGDTLTATT